MPSANRASPGVVARRLKIFSMSTHILHRYVVPDLFSLGKILLKLETENT